MLAYLPNGAANFFILFAGILFSNPALEESAKSLVTIFAAIIYIGAGVAIVVCVALDFRLKVRTRR